ncbi:hypothetical protein KR093_000836, partial [Drosophila rubida]
HDDDDAPLYACDGNNNNANINGSTANNENEPEPDAYKDDDSEFLQDVPYSSSSIDRSSIGSIPWADDAIKKNKLDWERVDRMLSGEETLPEQEVELRHEIADWQRKFPSLLARKAKPLKQHSLDNSHHNIQLLPDDAGDIDSISDLSLNSLDDYDERKGDGDEDDDDGFLTPTVERQQAMPSTTTRSRNYMRPTQNLVAMLDRDLRITSVALNLRKRREHFEHKPPVQATTMPQSATVSRSRSRLQMPPILNVLDSNRRFRGLLNNRSFVQLTQVQQQPKSAALTYASSAERRQQAGIRLAWNMPMAASRFLNNKHGVALPSLKRQMDFTPTATSSQSVASSNSSSLGSTLYGRGNHTHQHSHLYGQALLGETLVSTNANTPSTGRSISAAIHHPRSEFATSSAFFIPYSASKFKAFK